MLRSPQIVNRWLDLLLTGFNKWEDTQGAHAAILWVHIICATHLRRDATCEDDVKREIELPDGSRIANDNMWLFTGGRLFQQFVCTAAARVELKRMSTLQTPKMQNQLRAETYDQLKDALRNGYSPADIGRRVICPSSVKGSRRAMYVSTLTATLIKISDFA